MASAAHNETINCSLFSSWNLIEQPVRLSLLHDNIRKYGMLRHRWLIAGPPLGKLDHHSSNV